MSKKNRIGFENYKSHTKIVISNFSINYNYPVNYQKYSEINITYLNDNNITNYDFKYTNEFIDLLDIKNEFIVLENNECFLVKCKNCIQTSNSANILLINKNIILNNKIIDYTKLIESKKMIKEFEHFKKKLKVHLNLLNI